MSRRRCCPLLFAIVLSSATASADSAYPPPLPPEAPLAPPSSVVPIQPQVQPQVQPQYVVVDPEHGPKSPGTAFLLSFTATLAPPIAAAAMLGDDDGDEHEEEMLWILAGSALFGPSVGHWYAGKTVTPGLGVRALGFALGAAAFGADDFDEAFGLLMLGSTAIIGGAVYDVATAGRSARQTNFEHATRVMPVIAPAITPDGSAQLRLGVTGSF